MALKTFVKINGVNNLSDARYCAGMNVDLMGFCIDSEDDGYITPQKYGEITSWTSGVEFVGELGNSKIDNEKDLLSNYELNYFESNDLKVLRSIKKPVRKILNINLEDISNHAFDRIDLITVNKDTDEITDEDISIIRKLAMNNKVLIGYGIDADNVDEILEETKAYGIAISGGSEIRPGYKDYDELADILETLEVDEWA